jgi:phosphatidylglycerophosphatase A
MKPDLTTLIVTWFGAGLSKVAPGTVGSLATIPFACVLHFYGGFFSVFVFSVAMLLVGTYATHLYLTQHPEKSDPKEVVIDEVAGQSFVLCLLAPTIQAYIVGFILFRLFDVWKPWPISLADKKIKGATGVMIDDMIAAVFAVGVIFLGLIATQHIDALQPYSKNIFGLFGNVS